jgi:hypothetical protein
MGLLVIFAPIDLVTLEVRERDKEWIQIAVFAFSGRQSCSI